MAMTVTGWGLEPDENAAAGRENDAIGLLYRRAKRVEIQS